MLGYNVPAVTTTAAASDDQAPAATADTTTAACTTVTRLPPTEANALTAVVPPSAATSAEAILAAFLRGRADATIKAYQQDLRHLQAFVGLPSPASTVLYLLAQDVGIAHLTAINWRSDMIARGLSPATINRRLAALRAIVRLAHRVGAVTWILDIEGVAHQAYRDTRGPAFEQVNAILAATDTRRSPALAARDRAIIMLLAARALRCAEVVALQMTDLNLEEAKISITGKGQREATWVTIPPNAVEALRAWLAYRGLWLGPVFIALDRPGRETPLTTSSVRRLMGTLSEEIGVKVRPHGLRHAAITAALDQGHDLRSVQRFARHANPATTMIYDDNRRDFGGEIACSLAEGLGVR